MMQKFLILFLPIFLAACATSKPPAGYEMTQTQSSLAEASYAVSRSVVDLAETAQAAHPLPV